MSPIRQQNFLTGRHPRNKNFTNNYPQNETVAAIKPSMINLGEVPIMTSLVCAEHVIKPRGYYSSGNEHVT